MRAEFDKARELVAGARQAYRDAGMLVVAGALAMHESRVEWKAGNLAAAERTLEEGLAQLEEIGDRGFHGRVALMLAELRYVRGRYDDAGALCASARTTTEPSDLFNFVSARFDRGLPTRAGGPPRGGASAVSQGDRTH